MISSSPKNVATLTGLRAFAALWVAVFHLYTPFLKNNFLYSLCNSGHEGVNIFFILSGFILSFVYKKYFNLKTLKADFKQFILNRIARVYPLHVLCLIYVSVFYYVYGVGINDAKIFLYNLLLIQGWGLFELSTFSYNGASWSISIEWFWYLVFPFIIFSIKNLNKLYVLILLVFCCFFAFFLGSSFPYFDFFLQPICWGDPSGPFYRGRFIGYEGMYFCAGVFLYPLVQDFNDGKKWDYCCLVSFLYFLILFGWPEDLRGSVWSYFYNLRIILYIFIIVSLYKTTGIFKIIFGNKLAVYLGEISFALYMIHQWTLISLQTVFPQFYDRIVLCSLPIALVIASAIYLFFEIPSRRCLRKFFENPKQWFSKEKIHSYGKLREQPKT